MDKVIMHVDMDAFFAAVEALDNPALRGKPVIVGGTSERGVVATCSYEARAYGVRSAMPIYMAKANCPHGVFLPTRYWRYKEISNKIFHIFYQVTNLVEGLSIDEAYLDITALYKNPIDVAVYIKNKVKRETGLTISVGISYNKFLAKLASDWNKPDGLKIITKDMIPKILYPLSVDKVYGLGKKSTKKLNDIGIFTIEDLYKLPRDLMIEFFGKFGNEIYDRIRGIDRREVTISRERKSIGKETTLLVDTDNKLELMEYLKIFSRAISNLLKNKNMSGNNITVKIKTSSFLSHTRSRTLQQYINDENDIFREAASILEDMKFEEKIRLIGLSVSNLKENKIEQLTLWK
ncbi:DNA polymerase IV [Clostridium thermarum]|uniref:DNA polymerase IV n=1 Tax=Clostridium thermarum TaxID=1716543 RepID=UPI0013D452F0|nr:DNA polymerase IV [Clostridium thermarum]